MRSNPKRGGRHVSSRPNRRPTSCFIMTDDSGFGVPSTFGGVIPTPTMDRVAKAGLRYNNIHSTALCSPTRAALITGRNHHSSGFGVISEQSTGFPGYNRSSPRTRRPSAASCWRTAMPPRGSAKIKTPRPSRPVRSRLNVTMGQSYEVATKERWSFEEWFGRQRPSQFAHVLDILFGLTQLSRLIRSEADIEVSAEPTDLRRHRFQRGKAFGGPN
jgi:hypothetical protein